METFLAGGCNKGKQLMFLPHMKTPDFRTLSWFHFLNDGIYLVLLLVDDFYDISPFPLENRNCVFEQKIDEMWIMGKFFKIHSNDSSF